MLPQEYYSINPFGKDDFMSKIELQNSAYLPLSNAKESGTFTIHFWIYSDNDTDTSFDLCYGDNKKNIEIYAKHWLEVTEEIEMQEGDYLDIHFLFGGTYLIWHDKLEIGNFATDYTKAPEDMDMQIVEIRNTTNEFIQTTDETISRISETVVGIDGRVETAESEIKQNAHNISLKADKVELQGYVTFTDLGKDGTTVIDGGRIDTDSLFARDIEATGSISGATLNGGSLYIEGEKSKVGSKTYYPYINLREGRIYSGEYVYNSKGEFIDDECVEALIGEGFGYFPINVETPVLLTREIQNTSASGTVSLILPSQSGTLARYEDIKQKTATLSTTAYLSAYTETLNFSEIGLSFTKTPSVTLSLVPKGGTDDFVNCNPRAEIIALDNTSVRVAYWATNVCNIDITLNILGI